MTTDFVSAIAGQLVTQFQHEARQKTESSTRQAILNTRASEILTFVTPSGRQIKPEVSAEFVEALWCFARGTTFRELELDSAVTQPILTAAENTLVELLNSDQARQVILTTIAPSDTVRENLQAHVGSETFWATREILNAARLNPVHANAAPILNQTSSLTHDLLASSAGKAIMGGITKVIMTTQGKLLLAKLITVAAGKIAASTALKVMIVATLKKVGIAVLIKAAVVKILATVAPALLAAKIPVFWIIAPVIGILIYREIQKMPQKLAEKIPPLIAVEIERSFPEIASNFAQMILADTVREILNDRPSLGS
ncbi:MAG: hypothetical protein ACKO3T_13835 [Planctomycetaceae bacterium]